MSEPNPSPKSPLVAVTSQENPALVKWFDEQRLKSVDNIEAAAKQIITLTTTLLTTLLGLIAISGSTLPEHIKWSGIQWLGGIGIIALFTALATALAAIYPAKSVVIINDPDDREKAFGQILGRKSTALLASLITFGIGMLMIATIVIASLLRIY